MTVDLGFPLQMKPPPEHISHSAASSFLSCGEQYRLEKVVRVPQMPGWALVGGSALHLATEWYDLALAAQQDDRVQLTAGTKAQAAQTVTHPDQQNGMIEYHSETPSKGNTEPLAESAEWYPAQSKTKAVQLEALFPQVAREAVQAWDQLGPDDEVPALAVWELWQLAFESQTLNEQSKAVGKFSDPKNWRASGRVSKAAPNKEDRTVWTDNGQLFLHAWTQWRKFSGWQMAYQGHMPAIELDISGKLGAVMVKGFLDRVALHPTTGEPVVLDIKTSAAEPSDPEQLALYSVMLEKLGLPRPRWGCFWMARTGQVGQVHDLSQYPEEYFRMKFGAVKQQRDAGIYLPNTKSPFCRSCSVRSYCYAVNGSESHLIPRPWTAEALRQSVVIPPEHNQEAA